MVGVLHLKMLDLYYLVLQAQGIEVEDSGLSEAQEAQSQSGFLDLVRRVCDESG